MSRSFLGLSLFLALSASASTESDEAFFKKLSELNREQVSRASNQFVGPDKEVWTDYFLMPARLRKEIPVCAKCTFSVSTHYHARIYDPIKDRYFNPKTLVKDPTTLSREAELFWGTLTSGGKWFFTYGEIPGLLKKYGNLSRADLIPLARKFAKDYGLRIAREMLALAMPEQSESGTKLEDSLIGATRAAAAGLVAPTNDKTWDDFGAYTRSRTKFYIIYGQSHNARISPGVRAVDGLAEHLRQAGFKAETAPMTLGATSWKNAAELRDLLLAEAEGLDHIVLVPISKGTHVVTVFVTHLLPQMNTAGRKVKLVLSLSGVARYSYIARWVSVPFPAGLTRSLLKFFSFLKGGEERKNLVRGSVKALATDIWADLPKNYKAPDHLRWVSFAMLPDRSNGTQKYGLADILLPWIIKANPAIGPQDGATESASSILPPNSGIPQDIVRVYGAHNLTPGKYSDGTPVSARYHDPNSKVSKKQKDYDAGADLAEAILRSFPQSLIAR